MTDLAWPPPQRALLPDGRLHLSDGPIDLVIGLEGERAAMLEARDAAFRALDGLLPALAEEMPTLRQPLLGRPPPLRHPAARRMAEAAWPHRAQFITPMAAVAGAVAEHVLRAVTAVPGLTMAYVNNGGDIAIHLLPQETLRVGLIEHPSRVVPDALAVLRGGDGVRGIATSGWRGRSFSRGIADAVTVLAHRAPEADAAATIVGNAVDARFEGILRRPARDLDPDSDLLDLPVTVEVPPLPPEVAEAALEAGERCAETMLARGLILGACLRLQGRMRVLGSASSLAALHRSGAAWGEALP